MNKMEGRGNEMKKTTKQIINIKLRNLCEKTKKTGGISNINKQSIIKENKIRKSRVKSR